MLKREKQSTDGPGDLRSENLLYGKNRPALKKPPELPEEATEPEQEETRNGYKVKVQEAQDSFLAASGSAWIYAIESPEGEHFGGSASSRRKAEREIRKVIAKADREHEAERRKKEQIAHLEEHLLAAGLSQERASFLASGHPEMSLETLPGGYVLMIYEYRNHWGKRGLRSQVFKDGEEIISPMEWSEDKRPSSRKVRKKTLKKLESVLLSRAQHGKEQEPQSRSLSFPP